MNPFLFPLVCITLFSCKKDEPTSSQFQGTWIGAYSGANDHGTFNVVIDAGGLATGSLVSVVNGGTIQLNGTVASNGNITLSFGIASSGGTFRGTMQNTTASGTWENTISNPASSGSWTGNKR